MHEPFKILIDRLNKGETQKIDETLEPAFLALNEKELQFPEKVMVKGDAYLTDDHLIIRLKAKTAASMPCAICNEMIRIELNIEDFYHAQPVEEIPSAIFDFSEVLREGLLIGLPQYVECNKGKCPERATLAPYLKPKAREEKTTYFPFADMDEK